MTPGGVGEGEATPRRRALPPQVISTGWWLAYCLALAAYIAWAALTD